MSNAVLEKLDTLLKESPLGRNATLALAGVVAFTTLKSVRRFLAVRKGLAGMAGKTVLITGATSGIGEALAYKFAEQGCRLILAARREGELQRVKKACLEILKSRVTDQAELEKMVTTLVLDVEQYTTIHGPLGVVLKKFDQIDYLVNNAGISTRSVAAETKLEVDVKVMNTNFFGSIAITKALLPTLIASKAHIVNISSVAGLNPVGLRTSYCASKYAMHGWFESLRLELAPAGVDVTMVCPGPVKTNVARNALMGDGTKFAKADPLIDTGMDVNKCANVIIRSVAAKDYKVVVTSSFMLKFGLLLNRFMPKLYTEISKLIAQKMIASVKKA